MMMMPMRAPVMARMPMMAMPVASRMIVTMSPIVHLGGQAHGAILDSRRDAGIDQRSRLSRLVRRSNGEQSADSEQSQNFGQFHYGFSFKGQMQPLAQRIREVIVPMHSGRLGLCR